MGTVDDHAGWIVKFPGRNSRWHVPLDLESYRPRLDELWGTFGEDRLVFGSD